MYIFYFFRGWRERLRQKVQSFFFLRKGDAPDLNSNIKANIAAAHKIFFRMRAHAITRGFFFSSISTATYILID